MRGAASERVAEEVLRALGFKVIARRATVEIKGKAVAEVDLVVEPPKGPLAVEVKAGKVDVSAVRQAFANAVAIGMEPMIIGAGWANEEARLLAERLGVKYLMLQDIFLSDREEMYTTAKAAATDALAKILLSITPCEEACVLSECKNLKEFEAKVGKERAREILKSIGKAGNWEAVLASAKLSCFLWKALKR